MRRLHARRPRVQIDIENTLNVFVVMFGGSTEYVENLLVNAPHADVAPHEPLSNLAYNVNVQRPCGTAWASTRYSMWLLQHALGGALQVDSCFDPGLTLLAFNA